MPTTPDFFVNSPNSGSNYFATAGYQFIPNNGSSITVDVWAYTGINGGGSLIAVSSLTAATHDVTTSTLKGSFTDNSVNHVQVVSSNGTNGSDVFAARGSFTGSGVGSLKMRATYTGSPVLPSITSFTPGTGGPGASVVITGNNFTGVTDVKFNGVSATFSIDSNTQITATVPTGATTGLINIANPSGSVNSASNFVVAQAYINTGTPASPVWTAGVAAVNTGTPASPVWTTASQVAANTGTPASPVWTPGA